MAIVKMKKLRVMAMADQRDALLRGLLHLGCVEITEPGERLADPEWSTLLRKGTSHLSDTKSEITDVNTALAAIKRYAQVKDGLFLVRHPISEEDFLGAGTVLQARETSRKVGEALQSLTRLQNEESRLAARQASLTPWKDLDMPLETESTAHVLFRMGVFPGKTDFSAVRTALGASDAAAEIYEISADRQQRYCLLLCHRADEELTMDTLRPFGFSAVSFQGLSGTAAENLSRTEQALAENRQAQKDAEAAIAAEGGAVQALRVYADRLHVEADREANAERLMTDGTVLFFEGWAPADRMQEVQALLEKRGCAWEAETPTEEETPKVPVQLKNNWFTRPLNMVTEMYSLPSYGGVDPNPLMAPFFIFFYGFMMADMGYGLVMMLTSLFIMKKAKPNGPTMRYMIPLLGLAGAATFLMGALTGSFFGDLIPQLLKMIHPECTFAFPSLFSPLDDALSILLGSLAIGLVQIFTGMAVSVWMKCKRGEFMSALCGEIAWYAIFVCLGLGAALGAWKYAGIAVLVILVVTQGYGKKGIMGKLVGIGGSLYNNITGYFSDILSYSRLMALMLAGAVIAQVFNTLGAITGNVIAFFIIAMIGNALNFALNLLGCYVHDMRLQCLEFFNRFYEDGGKPFKPLEMQTQYVDVVKD